MVSVSLTVVCPIWSSGFPGLFRWLYERFRLPIAPVYGGFPVKFRTFLGDPIPYDPNTSAVELAERVSSPAFLYLTNCDCHWWNPSGNVFPS